MTASLQVRNWSRFQHYKNRRPPWIKLHREILDDMAFASLSIEAKAVLPLLWILASESDNGSVPLDFKLLAFRLRLASNVLADAVGQLVGAGFLECAENTGESDLRGAIASTMLASREQPASAEERRGEAETEGEGEKNDVTLSPSGLGLPDHVAHRHPRGTLTAAQVLRQAEQRWGRPASGPSHKALAPLEPFDAGELAEAISETERRAAKPGVPYLVQVLISGRKVPVARRDPEPGWMRVTREILEGAENESAKP